MCQGDHELKRQIDAALAALIMDGTVARVLACYHMPYHTPAVEPVRDKQGNTGEIIRHGVADRGLEPQMDVADIVPPLLSGVDLGSFLILPLALGPAVWIRRGAR